MNILFYKHIDNDGLADIGVSRLCLIRTAVIESCRAGMSTTDFMITAGFSAETISTILAMDVAQYSPIAHWFLKRRADKVKRFEGFKKRRRFMI